MTTLPRRKPDWLKVRFPAGPGFARIDRMHRDQDAFLRHELRNAISPILGYTELIRTEAGLEGTCARYVEQIRSSAESMERLLSDLRDLQAIERDFKSRAAVTGDIPHFHLESRRPGEVGLKGHRVMLVAMTAQAMLNAGHGQIAFQARRSQLHPARAVEFTKDKKGRTT